jgi:hypothetical protein
MRLCIINNPVSYEMTQNSGRGNELFQTFHAGFAGLFGPLRRPGAPETYFRRNDDEGDGEDKG